MKKNKQMNSIVRKTTLFAVAICAVFVFAAASFGATFTVTSNADSGANTLRDAITLANGSAGFDTIVFMGVTSIALASQLPAITDPVMIDGGATPTVELNGAGAGSAIGLWLRAGGCTVRGMVINRFGDSGIRMDTDGLGVDNTNTIIGNRIGTNTAGTAALGNINRGILIVGTTGHMIGNGTTAGTNLISGNSGRGIDVNAGGSATIAGNLIGTNAAGTGDVGNASHGIQIVNSSGSTIGGTTAGARNVISGNTGSGVFIIGDIGTPASNNVIQGNYIGVDSGGNTMLANTGSGVVIQDSNNTVGGTVAGARNVISGNSINGVSITSTLAVGNVVAGNYIGVGANGTAAIANGNDGVRISSQANNNIIGGFTGIMAGMCTGSCNTIANNGFATAQTARAGVYVDTTAGRGNQVRRNSIFNNGTTTSNIGIDIGASGPTANDANDPDVGANNLQNKPVMTTATNGGQMMGTLNSLPSTGFVIDFYGNDISDTAALSEGRRWIGSGNCFTDTMGNCTFNTQAGAPPMAGQFVTATATLAASPFDTSEFSDALAVTSGPAGPMGIEADVAPRHNGDGAVSSTDVVEIRKFQLGNFAPGGPYQNNEFQRADCAPFAAKGNGQVASTDVVQARRYQLGLDPQQDVGGPTAPGPQPPPMIDSWNGDDKARSVRVIQTESGRGFVTVSLVVDASGDEAMYGFSLNYDVSRLGKPVVTIGNAGGNVLTNTSVPGRIGFSVDFNGGTIGAGRGLQLVTIRFSVPRGARGGTTMLTFNDDLAVREVSSLMAEPLAVTFKDGVINVAGTK